MPRLPAYAAALCLALFAACAVAWGHGGNFRVPGGGGGGDPGDPSLPPQALPVPVLTPPVRGSVADRLQTAPAWRPADWQVWWQLHRDAYLPRGGEGGLRGTQTVSAGVFQVGRPFVGHSDGLGDPETERGVHELALPYLLHLLDRRTRAPEEMVAAALIAVGRIARDRPPLALIQGWAVDRKASLEVRESATLALGLLRRSDRRRQLPGDVLSDIRDFLFVLFDDRQNPTRVRAFATFSIALLADQPYGEAAIESDGRLVTRALWTRLPRKHASSELTVALLTTLGHQPPRGVPTAVREGLRLIVRKHPFGRRTWDAIERSHALTALARLGGPESLPVLLHTLCVRDEDDGVQAAALIGIALRAVRLAAADRVDAVRAIRRLVNADRHYFVRGLAHVALGTLLREDLKEGSHEVLRHTRVDEVLDREARHGSTITRPYSVLGLALSAHDIPSWSRPLLQHVRRVQETMTWGLERARGSDEVVGAYAVGAGLAGAEEARPLLLDILRDVNRSPSLRGHVALALGQLGRPTEAVVEGLLEGTKERISPFVHLQSVRALALLEAEGTREALLGQLRGQRPSRPALAAVAAALGRLQDPKTARALLSLARNRDASLYVRVAAVMALGLSFDPEPCPSRSLLTTHANYPALTWSMAQVFNIM